LRGVTSDFTNETDRLRLAVRAHLTADAVAAYFAPLGPARVERFEAANLLALNFHLYDALADRLPRSDAQGMALWPWRCRRRSSAARGRICRWRTN
jgi:hypothetical protein